MATCIFIDIILGFKVIPFAISEVVPLVQISHKIIEVIANAG